MYVHIFYLVCIQNILGIKIKSSSSMWKGWIKIVTRFKFKGIQFITLKVFFIFLFYKFLTYPKKLCMILYN